MFRLIFSNIHIRNRKNFYVFTVLFAVTFVVYCIVCVTAGVAAETSLEDFPVLCLLFLDFPGTPFMVYHCPLTALVYLAVSFFETLLIAWQTDLKEQRLNRFVLFFLAVDSFLCIIGLTIGDGLVVTVFTLIFLFLLLVLPTVIVIKVQAKKGILNLSDILTSEEIEEYKRKR